MKMREKSISSRGAECELSVIVDKYGGTGLHIWKEWGLISDHMSTDQALTHFDLT